MSVIAASIAAGASLIGKGVGAGVGKSQGDKAADEQNALEQANYQMQYENTVKQREAMDAQNSAAVMQSFDPMGQTQTFWSQNGGMVPMFKSGGHLFEQGGQKSNDGYQGIGPVDTSGYANRIRNLRKGARKNDDGSESTVLMSQMDNYAFPTLFQDGNGGWFELEGKDAFNEAKNRGELFEANSEDEARAIARGSWKSPERIPMPSKNWKPPAGTKPKSGGPISRKMKDGGMANLFKDGGQMNSKPSYKKGGKIPPDELRTSNTDPKKDAFTIYDKELGRCGNTQTKQCAQYVTGQGAFLTGMNWDDFVDEAYGGPSEENNAWQRRYNSLENGGVDVPDPADARVGDHVSIIYPGSYNQSTADRATNTEGNTHSGIVVGYAEDGEPIVRHNISGRLYNHRISKLKGITGKKLKLSSVYRPAAMNTPEYEQRLDDISANHLERKEEVRKIIDSYDSKNDLKISEGHDQYDNRKELVNFFNSNREALMPKLGLNNDDYNKYAKIVLGVFDMESSSNRPASQAKYMAKNLIGDAAHLVGLKDTEASSGPFRIKKHTNLYNEDGSPSSTKNLYDSALSAIEGSSGWAQRDGLLALSGIVSKSRKYENMPGYDSATDTYDGVPMDYIRAGLHQSYYSDNTKELYQNFDKDYATNVIAKSEDISYDGDATFPSKKLSNQIANKGVAPESPLVFINEESLPWENQVRTEVDDQDLEIDTKQEPIKDESFVPEETDDAFGDIMDSITGVDTKGLSIYDKNLIEPDEPQLDTSKIKKRAKPIPPSPPAVQDTVTDQELDALFPPTQEQVESRTTPESRPSMFPGMGYVEPPPGEQPTVNPYQQPEIDLSPPEEQLITDFDANWDYMRKGDAFYAKKKDGGDWILASGNPEKAIAEKVFNQKEFQDGGYSPYPYQDQSRTMINPTTMYKNGGRTLLQMVQAGNPQAYWPSANVGNYNNPGNVRRHRKNRDLRYPGSSQNFQGGGNLYAQNGMQGEVVPQEASFMSNLGGAVNQYGKNLVDPEVWKSFVDPSFWAKVPQALGDLGGEIMGGDPVGDRVTGQYNEQKQRERTKAVPNQYQQGGNLLQMVQAGNPNAYWPSANVGNYNNPGNVGRHRDNMDLRYPGSSQNFSKPNAQQGAVIPGTPIQGRPGFYNDQQGKSFSYYADPPPEFNTSGEASQDVMRIGEEINLRNPGQDLGTEGYYGPMYEQANRRYEGPEARRATPPASQGTPPPMGTIPQRQPDPVIPGGGGNDGGGNQGGRGQGGNERKFKRQQQRNRGKQGVPWSLGSGQKGMNQLGGSGGKRRRKGFEDGGNMFDALQDIGYDQFAAYQMGGGIPPEMMGPDGQQPGQPMPVEGGQLQPISDNSVMVQGDNPNEVDSVDVGNAKVDPGEMIKQVPGEEGQRVFSDTLKPPGSKETFSEIAIKLEKQKDPNKPDQTALIENKLDELFKMQQVMNGNSQGETAPEAVAGGMDPEAAMSAGKPIAKNGMHGRLGYQGGGYTSMSQAAEMQMQVPYPGGREQDPAFVPQQKYAQEGMFGQLGSSLNTAFKKPETGISDGMQGVFDGVSGAVTGGMNTFGNSYTAAYGRGTDQPYMGAMGTIGNVGQFGQSAGDLAGAFMGKPGAQYGGSMDLGFAGGGYAGGGFDYRNIGPSDMSFGMPMSMLAIGRRFPTPANANLDYLQRQAGGSWGEFSNEKSTRRESKDMGRNKRKYNDDTAGVSLIRRVKKLAKPSKQAMYEARGNTRKNKSYRMGGWLMPSIPLNKKSLTLSLLR